MEIITVDKNNIEEEHICCAIGSDKQNKSRSQSKKDWMKERFSEGLIFKKLDVRGKVFIEYMPVETAWKPIKGKNYMVINCLWVSGQYKGKGLSVQLLQECIKDVKEKKMEGIIVISSTKVKPFLTDKKFYLKHGFEVIDSAPPYFELLELKFNKKAISPQFTEKTKNGKLFTHEGFTFVYSNQCPFMEEYVHLLSLVSHENHILAHIIKLNTHQEAQETGTPWGTFGLYYQGSFLTHELMSEKKFTKLISDLKS